jgi:hypothetical protein
MVNTQDSNYIMYQKVAMYVNLHEIENRHKNEGTSILRACTAQTRTSNVYRAYCDGIFGQWVTFWTSYNHNSIEDRLHIILWL